ncbi:MAG: hypothetical protein CVT69_01175 [Actinobacteria bacterium HGW-Actinobacteria-9]|nr:MAG: hypothetical protein CVT69_01175 [Actinobacteria bacterium HGW-Actinobacteria-9]
MIETATNSELYKLVLADAPYVIAAYGVLWASLIVFVGMAIRRIMRLERQVRILEESIERRG